MSLRRRLLLAQLPLAAALVFLVLLARTSVEALGRSSARILHENQRSVVAAHRMNEAVERLDSAALFVVAGRADLGRPQAERFVPEFEAALGEQERNLTEPGEGERTRALRAAWTAYRAALERLLAASAPADVFFAELEPAFREVKTRTSAIHALNQAAMERKSDEAARRADETERIVLGVGALALLVGLGASAVLTARLLRPLRALADSARRMAEGKLDARVPVIGRDEIAALAEEFNRMAEILATLRASTLGELLEAQAAAQAAIDAFPDPILVLRTGGDVVCANAAADALFGTSRLPAGADPLSAVDPALRGAVETARRHVLSGAGAYLPEGFDAAIVLPGTGGERALLPRATPMRLDDDRVGGVALVLQDVTRLRRFDQLREDLVATVAHEFRTPLTSLHMAIHLCLEGAAGPVTGKQADLLQAAREDCERLQRRVDELLDLAALQAGAAPRRAMRPGELLDAAVQANTHAAELRSVTLEAEPCYDAAKVEVAPDAIAMAFANLVANAARYSPVGASVRLRAKVTDEEVRFEVADEGPGIAKEQQERLFHRFTRLPGAPRGGSGLGLSIVRRVVEAHRGIAGVESEPGHGATFWFTLPRSDAGRHTP